MCLGRVDEVVHRPEGNHVVAPHFVEDMYIVVARIVVGWVGTYLSARLVRTPPLEPVS
jgi:hypothetical protein